MGGTGWQSHLLYMQTFEGEYEWYGWPAHLLYMPTFEGDPLGVALQSRHITGMGWQAHLRYKCRLAKAA